ncbi:MAG: NUDIX hydrolase [Clostridiaceae bacterium]|nr:NUDIX hydrolase [Eubacteriales bacterium]MDD4138959.1 NUDIX hydrolase [Eubacteriales bacterium]MDD4744384.1 NUDIX hydrolase [Eubacteriales bacterium]NLB46021.1 NUDIX hydrolase [Clostridiaceae bacterium]
MYQEPSHHVEQPFTGRVFNVEVHAVTVADGQTARREIVRHNGGACVLAIDGAGFVPMVTQYRKAFDRDMLEIPAGKLEPGEDPLDCARRELAEETGFCAGQIRHLATIYPSPGYCSETLHIYLATDLEAGPAHPDDGEFLHVKAYPLDDLLAMADRGEIHDAKTLVALLMADRKLTREER